MLDFRRFERRLRVAQRGHMKLIWDSDGGRELYDIARDPLELHDLKDKHPDIVKKLEADLERWLDSFEPHKKAPPVALDKLKGASPRDLDALRGLGYIR